MNRFGYYIGAMVVQVYTEKCEVSKLKVLVSCKTNYACVRVSVCVFVCLCVCACVCVCVCFASTNTDNYRPI